MKIINLLNIPDAEMYGGDENATPYIDKNVALIRSVNNIDTSDDAVFIDGYILLVIEKGHLSLTISGSSYELDAHDGLTCSPRNFIERCQFSEDAKVFGFFFSKEYGQMLSKEAELAIQDYSVVARHHVTHLNALQYKVLKNYDEIVCYCARYYEPHRRTSTIRSLLIAVTSEIHHSFVKGDSDWSETSKSAPNQLIKQFYVMLSNESESINSVNEVARRLAVSPKYFSNMCKMLTGRTASEIINENIVENAKILLRNPENSIKMVSVKLGFANQSHFGTFIRRHTGKSPFQLRKEL